ncbi:MAG: helix-turn-helix transcriptional regulator [Clostridia bacterium]|nr:helix-turn-helix transcriptional regulator [Clostridia bacterium]
MFNKRRRFPLSETAEKLLCDHHHDHPDLDQLHGMMPDDDRLYDLADLFRVFGDSTRMRILYALFESELCVCDLADLLGMTQSAVSHQLRTLKGAKLVRFRREGKSIIYALDDDHVRQILRVGLEHLSHN